MISKEIEKSFEEIDLLKDLNRSVELLRKHDDYFIDQTIYIKKPDDSMVGMRSFHLLQSSLFRSKILMRGFFCSLNTNNPLSSSLNARAHLETTALVGYLYKKLSSYYNRNIDLDNLNKALHKLSLGIKIPGRIDGAPEPINVMTMIDDSNKMYRKLSGDKDFDFRLIYDELSEFCHPNSFGLIGSHDIIQGNKIIYKTGDDYDVLNFLQSHRSLLISSSIFLLFYEKSHLLLAQNEQLPISENH